ncbi:UDP-2,4-diacetamido-2,4,6-trideoxy-beta-L-altropyranose hydrolase [Moritella sp. 24]|uniref:UDP-2,4-diacetamido-2,4, 6-trideoxy-beta-L-altropyranose hydrolase n=1 Tax=Moritella sp. 24 TaxID=2746230 RepID=UPI001BA89D91|nr:UDP-2,4-diacetamido-2,4,6-trideoxy-beta-L-altropyranose hydrolase [Moritella sp. 24]QUM77855.1 UDP-2,4-diacetamido-2,4,6-trideoxy-beta-L-altropyranose hydrolase [Moritella sp. 24]
MSIAFFFRVDVSSKIGLGHLYRSLTLAEVALTQGVESHFICREHGDYDHQLVVNRGFKLHLLAAGANEQKTDKVGDKLVYQSWLGVPPLSDAAEFIAIMRTVDAQQKVAIADHYGIEACWESTVKKSTDLLLRMSDRPPISSIPLIADIILDPTLGRAESEYAPAGESVILAGTQFALINNSFVHLRDDTLALRQSQRTVNRILVTFGGSDPLNLTSSFLSLLTGEPSRVHYHVVCGSCNAHLDSINTLIKGLVAQGWLINLHIDTNEMALLTAKADLAIGAAGSACWERAVLGLPSIIVAFENNQLDIAQALADNGGAEIIDINDFNAEMNVAMALLINDADKRYLQSKNAALLCDGHGANRVVKKLKEMLNEKL